MARLESIACGGFFATPPELVPAIAGLVRWSAPSAEDWTKNDIVVCDPCAGDCAAALALLKAGLGVESLTRNRRLDVSLLAVELEKTRQEAAVEAVEEALGYAARNLVLLGDAFNAVWEIDSHHAGVTLLYLNPPYDTDREHGRLEERFLDRFAALLCPGGVLLFVVPQRSLAASAETLARRFENIHVRAFPGEHYHAYKQVVLVATKRATDLREAPEDVVASIERAASLPLQELGDDEGPLVDHPQTREGGVRGWSMAQTDLVGLCGKIRPWHGVQNILPDPGCELSREFPLATPPRPAHIAMGVAAGVFNGRPMSPDDDTSGLPEILVKGCFRREFRTVDEKFNADNEKTAEVQVQQAKLEISVLDLSTYTYTDIRPSADKTGAQVVSSMTAADLLDRYGRGMMARMLERCPVLHDGSPTSQIPVAPLLRPPFAAQAQAIQATVKLLQRRGSAIVLGEIGSGKTLVSLAAAATAGARRILVLCPPHLVDEWPVQVEATLPGARVALLRAPSDVQKLAEDRSPGTVVAVLSREAAKLGHAWAGVEGDCPRCGRPTHAPPAELARTRARCKRRPPLPDAVGQVAVELARALAPWFPGDGYVTQLLFERRLRQMAARRAEAGTPAPSGFPSGFPSVQHLIGRLLEVAPGSTEVADAVEALLMVDPTMENVRSAISLTFTAAEQDPSPYGWGNSLRKRAVSWLLTQGDNHVTERWVQALWERNPEKSSSYYGSPETYRSLLVRQRAAANEYHRPWQKVRPVEGGWEFGGVEPGAEAALDALKALSKPEHFAQGDACGEQLYQAVPEPRRTPLATYITRHYPWLFDLLVLDEGHEYSSENSAQSHAAHRLVGLGKPTILLSGSISNGYAASLFTNLWYLSRSFREEFDLADQGAFVERYGYRKQVVQEKDREGSIVAWGSVTDRVERSARVVGDAPGVVPLLVLRHLLPLSVTMQKSDMALDLPPSAETVAHVQATDELSRNYKALQTALLDQIKEDRFSDEGLSGKLFGALAELPSYLDLATEDAGNCADGGYEIRYPDSCGGRLVARAEPLPASTLLPKEEWVIAHVMHEIGSHRNVMVFCWHAALLQRFARILKERTGHDVAVLDPAKVPTKKRQAWIDKEVVKKHRRILVTNPVCVQTGLNNLVHFSTIVWAQNPACNPTVKRQADGRVDRIGQTKDTRILFPVYGGTTQEKLHQLLMHKVAVARAVDGLDAEEALRAAGLGDDDGFSSFSVGRQLYEMLQEGS